MSANEVQVAGDHYKAEYQHWDWVSELNIPYLPANATKYLTRWRKKGGLEDLKKARHYIVKYIEEVKSKDLRRYEATVLLNKANSVHQVEGDLLLMISLACQPDLERLTLCLEGIDYLISKEFPLHTT